MSFPVEQLMMEVAGGEDLQRLRALCSSNGILQAIDVAMLDAEMQAELLGVEAAALGGVLQRAVALAQPLIKGWAINVYRPGSRGGIVPSGEPALVQALPKADSRPVRAHVSIRAGVSPGEAFGLGASGTEPGPVRASRLLRALQNRH